MSVIWLDESAKPAALTDDVIDATLVVTLTNNELAHIVQTVAYGKREEIRIIRRLRLTPAAG
jgi:hypothetical protein